jgi:hypothetical protein
MDVHGLTGRSQFIVESGYETAVVRSSSPVSRPHPLPSSILLLPDTAASQPP